MSIVRVRGSSPVATGPGVLDDEGNGSLGYRGHLRRSFEQALSLLRRDDCTDTETSNTCEKPAAASSMTLPIVLGTVIPLCVAIVVLIMLHRRNVRRMKMEDVNDPTKGLDFGLDDGAVKKGGRKSLLFGGEKNLHKHAQLSMDMNLSSPYLLPPGVQGSQDSIHSLTRTIHTDDDPYRPVAQYATSDAGSIRSFNPGVGGPLRMPPPRTNSMPRSPTSLRSPAFPEDKVDPFATPKAPKPAHHLLPTAGNIHNSDLPVQPAVPETDSAGAGSKFNADEFEMPDIPAPPPAALKPGQGGPHSPPNEPANSNQQSAHDDTANHARASKPPGANEQEAAGLGLEFDIPGILSPGALPHEQENGPLYDEHGNQPRIQMSQHHDSHPENPRGRPAQRQPSPGAPRQRGLGVPQQANKRLSVGFRPLPPSEVTESEDPEFRANRIRSFYKEYFDDSKEAPPPMPNQPKSKQPQQNAAEYYEDYDEGYLGEAAAYYDAETNAFIMPYAQPVTRRAMTPPPVGRSRDGPGMAGPRAGPRGGPRGPHGPHGSLGGMSLPGGPGRPRAGSAVGPRPGSSASGWGRQQPKKNLPPPVALTTLPTPSKLKDDAFAINVMDFAPPDSIRDKAAGRSQSPFGERRPFQQPKVPAVSPLTGAFEELAVLPSPHMLQTSGTFTNLEFAPPKKFKDGDNASDAGSIRSNKSGMSAQQLNAIRSGAGRVSRLPGDTVFTASAMDDQLKPQWGMRQM